MASEFHVLKNETVLAFCGCPIVITVCPGECLGLGVHFVAT